MTIEEMKKELARFAGQEDEAAVLPQALLSIIELAESGNVGSSQQLLEIKALLSKLSSKAEEDHGEQKVANAKIIEEVNGVLTQLAKDVENNRGEQKVANTKVVEEVKEALAQMATKMNSNHGEQKAESAKTNKGMKIIMALLGVNILGMLAILFLR